VPVLYYAIIVVPPVSVGTDSFCERVSYSTCDCRFVSRQHVFFRR
jgi:hypothetical protein